MNYLIMIGQKIMNKERIINYLDELFINPKCELEYTKDYELLLSVMLSAQTTDKTKVWMMKTRVYTYAEILLPNNS